LASASASVFVARKSSFEVFARRGFCEGRTAEDDDEEEEEEEEEDGIQQQADEEDHGIQQQTDEEEDGIRQRQKTRKKTEIRTH